MRRSAGRAARGIALIAAVLTLLSTAGGAGAAAPWTFDVFGGLSEAGLPTEIAAGPDGNLWFTEQAADAVGTITPEGAVTTYPIPTADPETNPAAPVGIAAGADGNLWVAVRAFDAIAKVTTAGGITLYPLPLGDSVPIDIALGPDGALWFTERGVNRIGRITTDGTITDHPVPGEDPRPTSIVAGPDGAMWFVEQRLDRIGRIDVVTREISDFPLTTGVYSEQDLFLGDVAAGADGAIWFAEAATNTIGRLAPDGSVTAVAVPRANASPAGMTLGPDGNVWFTERDGNAVGYVTPSMTIADLSVPVTVNGPFGITSGPDDNIWFTGAFSDTVGRLNLPQDGTPPSISITSPEDDSAIVLTPEVTEREGFAAAFECVDEPGGSGLASCVGTVANGDPLDTSPGVHGLTVTATDNAGNTATLTHSYIVFVSWTGKLAPPPAWSTGKAGTPSKAWFDLGGDLGTDLFVPGSPSDERIDCETGDPIGPSSPADVDVRFAGGRYSLHWVTQRSWEGTCRALTLGFSLGDGVTLRLPVRF